MVRSAMGINHCMAARKLSIIYSYSHDCGKYCIAGTEPRELAMWHVLEQME